MRTWLARTWGSLLGRALLPMPESKPIAPADAVQVYYDLKRLLEESKAAVPPELARHEAAKQKPGAITGKRDQVQFARGT